ncbi:YpmA family protein [Clostridium sp. CX1]|uniref:YpmA family protein n=1 Tax=Clostridium tanneri TaxID=3037988 RepID=A0ABU4JUY0_9CLOT|nr:MULTISPECIES: YpmA family protein [unclassified Clostridium]MCT8975548.1 YpmA family protein [Clostridium sp. CX1]MDW8801948.1 YpmA family protein [Clostridium sp. A1-XYC3]
MKDKLELIASKEFNYYEEMYKVVDFLNKNLSEKDLVFGITEKDDKHIINIYKEK